MTRTGPSLTLGVDVDVPPEVAWDLLVRVQAWPSWGPTVRGATLDDGADRLHAGSTGIVQTAVGASLPFRITDWSEAAVRRWSWSVAGIPATVHTVRARGDGCRVEMSAPWWATAYAPVLWLGLRRIKAVAEAAV